MEVRSITNIIGWEYNTLVKEFKTTYDYDNGSDVTVVERRSYTVQTYDSAGQVNSYPNRGNQIDITI